MNSRDNPYSGLLNLLRRYSNRAATLLSKAGFQVTLMSEGIKTEPDNKSATSDRRFWLTTPGDEGEWVLETTLVAGTITTSTGSIWHRMGGTMTLVRRNGKYEPECLIGFLSPAIPSMPPKEQIRSLEKTLRMPQFRAAALAQAVDDNLRH